MAKEPKGAPKPKGGNGAEEKPARKPAEEKAARKPAEREAEARKPKRGIAATVELPSLVAPVLVWLGLLALGYLVSRFDSSLFSVELDVYAMWVVGAATLLLLIAGPAYRNFKQLNRPFAKAIVLGGGALTLLLGGFAVFAAADFGQPAAQGFIAAGPADAKKIVFHAPGPGYRLILKGHFPEVDHVQKEAEEAAARGEKKKSQGGTYKLSGGYSLRLSSADGATVLDNYNGKFEQERTFRRISKKGRGYLDVVRTTMAYPLKVNQAGDYQLQVVSLGDKLEPKVEYAVYADRQFPLVYGALGLIMVFLYGLIDTLIKPLRVDSYFALCIGMTYGFLAYFASTAMPGAPFSVLGVSLMVGGLVGGALAYAVFLAGAKLYQNINRRWQLSLS